MTVVVATRVHFEALLADLSAQFVNLPADRVDDAIQSAQRSIIETLELDRSTLFQFSDVDGGDLIYTHYWARPGVAGAAGQSVGQGAFPLGHGEAVEWRDPRVLEHR